jgi:hypothetical protein
VEASPEDVHGRVGDGVMGVVSVDNLVLIARHFGHLPPEVILVETEPVDENWGDGSFEEATTASARGCSNACATVRRPAWCCTASAPKG